MSLKHGNKIKFYVNMAIFIYTIMNLYIFSQIELLDIVFTPFMARCKFIRGTKHGFDSEFVSNEFLHLFIFYANFFRSCCSNLSDSLVYSLLIKGFN